MRTSANLRASGIALVAWLAACSALGIALAWGAPRTHDATTTRAAAGTAARGKAIPTTAPAGAAKAGAGGGFDVKLVRDRRAWTYVGKKTIDVALLDTVPGADLGAVARACTEHFVPGFQFAQCYVFRSQAEYDYKNYTAQIDPALAKQVGISNLCWTTLSRQEPGKPAVVADMRQAPATWKQQGCPGW